MEDVLKSLIAKGKRGITRSERELLGWLDKPVTKTVKSPPWLTEFHLFPELPIEIRLMIWALATIDERVVEVLLLEARKLSGSGRQKTVTDPATFTSRSFVPAILHTCVEARTIGLNVYEPLTIDGMILPTYVQWDSDTIFVPGDTFRELLCNKVFSTDRDDIEQKCQRIAVTSGHIAFKDSYPSLKEIICVQKDIKPSNIRLIKGLDFFGPASLDSNNSGLNEDTGIKESRATATFFRSTSKFRAHLQRQALQHQ